MRIGIFGLPQSGQTTIFNALTRSQATVGVAAAGQREANLKTVNVPDPRVDLLTDLFHPRKTVYAQVQYLDVAGSVPGGSGEGTGFNRQILAALAQSDALLGVVRAFSDDDVFHPLGSVNPARDLKLLQDELILADLGVVERRIERLGGEMGKKFVTPVEREAREKEWALLQRFQEHLNNEQPLRTMDLSAEDWKLFRSFGFLSEKPLLVVVNSGETEKEIPGLRLTSLHTELIFLRGAIEMEISQLTSEEANIFLAEYDIEEPGLNRVIRASYHLLGLQSFFTVGEDEVRAWTIEKGTRAVVAAGVIHSDLQQGFIRAETISYDDMIATQTMAAARTAGKLRLEGKEYIVQDGDILNIRFALSKN
ncbi:MAG: redox-regulated ATPase YchF [Chloroflexi bacterium]|nr:redox-regulated ATPase YchF [Chloroflexota bacterium]